MSDIAGRVLDAFNALVLAYFVLLNAAYLFTSLAAFGALRRYVRRLKTIEVDDLLAANALPITLIAPAYNEEATCVESVRSLLALRYPDYEILVVNDGSKDHTLARLTEAFDLAPSARAATADLATKPIRDVYRSRNHPGLWVVDKVNGGKADTLNAGLTLCHTPLFCAMDADSLLEREALTRIVRPFLEDASTVAAGGTIRIVNGCRVEHGIVTDVRLPATMLPRFQVLEYLRAFLAGRMGWAALDATLIISGAFGLFRRSTVVEAGGFATDTVGEDMELVVRLHKHCRTTKQPYRVHFVPDPVAWTECPETARVLSRQRERWQRGLVEVLTRHRSMLLNPRYGVVGMLAYPYFFLLEMVGPIIEAAGYFTFLLAVALGRVSLAYGVAFFLVAFVLGAALSIAAIALEELSFRRYPRRGDLVRLLLLALVEPFGYRQMTTWWRLKGVIAAARGKTGWGEMTRRGFASKTA